MLYAHPGLTANASLFDFRVETGSYSKFIAFAVYAFSGHEEVCKPYEFSIELISPIADVDSNELLGAPAWLSIKDRSGEKRMVHGIIRAMEQLHTANRYTHYRCTLVPRLWFLGQIRDHRIFQHLTVADIIQKILHEQGYAAETYSFKLFGKYEEREYCVQYGETDLHFITRLCEEEGIYFYFKHSEGNHCLCFADGPGGPKIAGESDLRFFPGSGQVPDTAVISRVHLHSRVNSNAVTFREWNFTAPRMNLEAYTRELDPIKAPRPRGMHLERYQFPHLYQQSDPGRRYANIQIDRQLVFRQWIEAYSDVSRYLPGHTFHIHKHPNNVVNSDRWVVVRHRGE